MPANLDAVTGAFGYTGKYIAGRLLQHGKNVITLTGHPDRPSPFGDRVPAFPFNFDTPSLLVETLQGVDTLYNTYWIRFAHGGMTFEQAVRNSRILFQAAKDAGVRRVVHTSILNPNADSPLPYFNGKALVETALVESGISYAILRPGVIFGREDILVNNMAFLLRRFPIFPLPGDGEYRLQPTYVEDFADLAVEYGQSDENVIADAVGPEVFTFKQLLSTLAVVLGKKARYIRTPPNLAWSLSRLVGFALGDILLTADELVGLMDNLLVSAAPPEGKTSLTLWARENIQWLGSRYASEIDRHFKIQPNGPLFGKKPI